MTKSIESFWLDLRLKIKVCKKEKLTAGNCHAAAGKRRGENKRKRENDKRHLSQVVWVLDKTYKPLLLKLIGYSNSRQRNFKE